MHGDGGPVRLCCGGFKKAVWQGRWCSGEWQASQNESGEWVAQFEWLCFSDEALERLAACAARRFPYELNELVHVRVSQPR